MFRMLRRQYPNRQERMRQLQVDRLVLAELNQQSEDNSQRQANIIARVAVAMAMNGVALVPLFADGLIELRSWPGVLWLLPLIPAVLSITFGFQSIRLWASKGSSLSREDVTIWRNEGTESRIIDRLISDRIEILEKARSDLEVKIKWHRYSVRALKWTAGTMLIVFLTITLLETCSG